MLLKGNCLETLKTLADNSVDSIVTDPPYELGFMGKSWDASGIANNQDLWAECLRVLKPGGHLLAFSGSRTYHRMTVAIEDAGFEIRDQIMWLYGSGFPKSLDVSKAIDKAAGAEREVTATKPQTGAKFKAIADDIDNGGFNDPNRTEFNITAPATPEAQRWQGWGTALKPAHEPICVARKPLTGTVASNVLEWGTGALNIDGSRVGIAGATTRSGESTHLSPSGAFTTGHQIAKLNTGRWPANVIHDGSEEVLAGFPRQAGAGGKASGPTLTGESTSTSRGLFGGVEDTPFYGDSGSAARFFFSTKGDYDGSLWHDLNLHPETANTAEGSSSLQSQYDASVLVHVLNMALPEGLRCVGLLVERSMSVTENESKQIVESVMQATQSIAAKFWLGSSLESITLSSNHAKVVATHEPTGITTITTSLRKSDGYAEPVTFSITPTFSGHGEKASSGKSFIYCAKASKSERNAGLEGLPNGPIYPMNNSIERKEINKTAPTKAQNFHPTVKPLALMRYLVKLVTPLGGTVLDPFLGSGSTAVAAILEGFDWVGCEMTEDYWPIIEARVQWAENQPRTLL